MRHAQAIGEELAGVTVSIPMRAGEEGKLFGSVTNIHIEKALKAKGLNVDRRKIHLEEPIKNLGEFEVPVRLAADLSVSIKVSVIPEDGSKASA
jgi:large subunit ribosomal protein L9